MRYKTTIEIVSEAENKAEALEIVGEYLSGNIVSGIDMKCGTKRMTPYKSIVISVVAVSLLLTIGVLASAHMKTRQTSIGGIYGIDAVQPPLKTSSVDDKSANFKKEWKAKHTSEALNRIRK